jgi:hypothetical protein
MRHIAKSQRYEIIKISLRQDYSRNERPATVKRIDLILLAKKSPSSLRRMRLGLSVKPALGTAIYTVGKTT